MGSKGKLQTGSVFSTSYYGSIEILEDIDSRNVTIKFLDTGYIRYDVNRADIVRGKVKDPSLKSKSKTHLEKVGRNTINSYLIYKGLGCGNHKYFCKLCESTVETKKRYSESNIPKSCGCISKLKPKSKDLTGETVNGILVYGYMSEGVWKVKYSCGHYGELTTFGVKVDRTTSLCKSCTFRITPTLDHGHAKRSGYSPEYNSWVSMKRRCDDDNHNRYKFYKGKGITYPDEWRDFNVFLSDMGYKPDPEYSIERLDINLPYSKENCIWASVKTQANNKSSNILVIKEGQSVPMSLKHWCDLEGINYQNAHYRFKYKGVSVEDILGSKYSLK